MSLSVLFFSPHSNILSQSVPEALLAEALVSQGYKVKFATCGTALSSRCLPMDSDSLPEDADNETKSLFCKRCIRTENRIVKRFGFDKITLRESLTEKNKIEIDKILSTVTQENIHNLEVEGVKIGIAALYTYHLNQKKYSSTYNENEWRSVQKRVYSCLVSYFSGKNILEKVRPSKIVFYNSSYSWNYVVRELANNLGIECFSITAGVNWTNAIQKLHIANYDSFSSFAVRNKLWDEKFKKIPSTHEGLLAALSQQKVLLQGNLPQIYGGGTNRQNWRELRKKWGVKDHQKLLFIATSSYDELYSAQLIGAVSKNLKMAFSTQLEWIEECINFVSKRPDLFLVIRIHPRELPNKRDSKTSEHAHLLEQRLKNLPENIAVNWPSDGMSLYDWLEVIDLGLVAWSSAAKEFSSWGIPSLVYTGEMKFYPKQDLCKIADSKSDYFNAIDDLLINGVSDDVLYLSYRWLAFEMDGAAFDLTESIPNYLMKPYSFWMRVLRKLTFSYFEDYRWLLKHKKVLSQAKLMAKRIETGSPSEEILIDTKHRLSEEEEQKEIRDILVQLAEIRFGPDWSSDPDPSPLRKKFMRILQA